MLLEQEPPSQHSDTAPLTAQDLFREHSQDSERIFELTSCCCSSSYLDIKTKDGLLPTGRVAWIVFVLKSIKETVLES